MDKEERVENTEQAVMSMLDFARLGEGQVAYVKQIDSAQARSLFPAINGLPDGIDLFAVVNADGTPLGLADSRDSAIASAMAYDLEPVSVH